MRVVILAEDLYEEMELWYPYFRLREEKIEVVIAGTGEKKTYAGKNGYPVTVDTDTTSIKAVDFQGIIVPGGYAPDKLRRYPEILQFIREMDEEGKLVATICHGPWVFISAGIMHGRRATAFYAIKDDLINAGALYLDAEVIVDGNLVTSRKPDDLPAFCREVIAFLKSINHGTEH